MTRVQLALNVSDVDAAVEFYGKLFGVEPAKRRPGYANFALETPPLKLVLIENPDVRGAGVAGALNHLGVEVETTDEVSAAAGRLAALGLATAVQENTACCYAVQDKVWVDDPDGAPWEVYTVLADSDSARPGSTPSAGERVEAQERAGVCCTPAAEVAVPAGAVNLLAGEPVSAGHCC
ncbi:ArsI/CadI family heavy metal resistance metalloenzyme [Pseudofrankia sp. DC12]|uniref:ArsI/CadI family heavy metal resistance metalloenzyme n=1 Tax=Pseudofrankia sp. DC12 TaxID=683315 RepID=UPI0005F78409|nr:ArsI/CadI family heavy metal resistance metalloenzyme [Pseudofrankia sp. DC12]